MRNQKKSGDSSQAAFVTNIPHQPGDEKAVQRKITKKTRKKISPLSADDEPMTPILPIDEGSAELDIRAPIYVIKRL